MRFSNRDHRHKAGDDVRLNTRPARPIPVMAGLVPAISIALSAALVVIGITGTSPVMT
jgi:hypothetical protein